MGKQYCVDELHVVLGGGNYASVREDSLALLRRGVLSYKVEDKYRDRDKNKTASPRKHQHMKIYY
jgi:hypothetical protein